MKKNIKKRPTAKPEKPLALRLVRDAGAAAALRQRQKSLLPVA